MQFKHDKAIYLQLADRLCEDILNDIYCADERIPSVRDFAVMLEVNNNTVVKAYDLLSLANIIYTKRGLGYFVCAEAKDKILIRRREKFMRESLPELFHQMELLDITIHQVNELWKQRQEAK